MAYFAASWSLLFVVNIWALAGDAGYPDPARVLQMFSNLAEEKGLTFLETPSATPGQRQNAAE